MAKKILQINAHSNLAAAELAEEYLRAAEPISAVPGLVWKIFGLDEERTEAAGLYLFEDAEALQAYLDGPIMAGMRSSGVFDDITTRTFDVATEATLRTRGPI